MSGSALLAALIWSAHFRLSDLVEKRSEPAAIKGTAEAKRHGSYFISLQSRGGNLTKTLAKTNISSFHVSQTNFVVVCCLVAF